MLFIQARNGFVLFGVAALLAAAGGCGSEQPNTNEKPSLNIEPTAPHAPRAVEDLKNDLKPPVVIKPNAPSADGAAPAAPTPK